MKKLFLFLLAGMFAGGAFADTNIALTVNGSDGTKKSYNITEIENITFSDDQMIFHLTDGEDTFDIDAIEDMVFGTVSGIDDVFDGVLDGNLHVRVERGILTAELPDGMLHMRIFDMGGRMVGSTDGESGITYDLTRLGSGTYIIVVNEKAIKFIR